MPAFSVESEHRWRGADGHGGILAPADYPETRALRGETVAPGIDFCHADKMGVDSWLRVSAAPYRGDAADILGAVATLEDVSDDKRISRRIREHATRLKRRSICWD